MSNNINTEKQVNDLEKAFADLRREVSQAVDVLQDYKKTTQKLPSDYLNSLNKIKDAQEQYNKTISRANGELEQYAANKKEEQRINKALLTAKAKLNQSTSKEAQELAKLRFETNQQNRATREAATLSSKLATEYQKLVVKMNQTARVVQNLNAKKLQGIKLTDKEQAELNQSTIALSKYQNAVRGADASVGRFQRNVGNYPKAMGAAANAVRSLASAMGLVGGAYLFVNVMRDAFNRVREFDKAMQNISGILRTNRSELKDLEKEIIAVAGSSIKTSREVAELAENLVTLGKTKEEIKQLLKPVNDLSIGLETTSGEAAEFLVQMLNTFQASTDEAGKYADVIATIRTSTSLDFQRMRDSFQYLAPISKVLNKDLAYTGALIGILSDNGIKAERAGRLLGTAQQKLATENKSLNDALEEINQSIQSGASELETLALASKLMGKQSASLGVVLANNTDIIDKNAEAIRNNSGALEDLTNEQLESLDAKLKILDSTWEKFILRIENGDGVISKVLKGAIDLTTNWIDLLNAVNTVTSFDFNEAVIDKQYNLTKEILETTEQSKEVLKSTLTLNEKRLAQLKTEEKFNDLSKDQLKENEKEQLQQIGIIKALREKISEIDKETTSLDTNTKALEENKEVRKKGNLVKENSVKYYQNIISKLEEEQSRLATNSREWQIYEKQINDTKDSLNAFLASVEKVEIVTDIESFEEAWQNVQDILLNPVKIEGLDYDKIESELDQWSKDFEAQQKEIFETHKYYAGLRESLEQELSNNLKDLAFSVVDSIFQKQLESLDNEERINQQKADVAMQFAEGNAEAQAEIQRQLVEEQRRIEQEKIEVERKAFLFQQGFRAGEVAIDTLQSVAEIKAQAAILAANPFTAPLATVALAQIPLVITSGAVATGAILAQTLPAFKDGVRGFDGGLAVVGDGGKHEYIKTPEGEFYKTPKTDTLVNLPKGSDVYKDQTDFNKELDKMLDFNGIFKESRNTKTITIENPGGISEQTYQNGVNRLEKAINSKSALQVVFDESGNHKYILKGQAKRELLNKVFKIESRRV